MTPPPPAVTLAPTEDLSPSIAGYTLQLHDSDLVDALDGWLRVADIATDTALREALLARAGAAAATELAAVPATWVVEKAAWFVATAALAQQLQVGAHAPLEQMRLLHGTAGWAEAVATSRSDWRAASGESLAADLAATLAPLVEALRPARSPRAMWLSVGDRLAQAALWAGAALGREEEAVAFATCGLLAATPLRAPARFEWVDGTPRRRRVGCCLSYRCAEGTRCEDCPVQR